MRSTDARWHLAVEALARMPELAHRLVEVHHADEKGYCRGCTVPGGTLFVRWPCGLYRLATAATAPAPSPRRRFGPGLRAAHREDAAGPASDPGSGAAPDPDGDPSR
ncbi:MAG: hypothetical protein JOY78_04060 [Pseudonocardia sp.]|nr:hypothetical protein [Pseudonocardia sp.]